MPDRNDSPPTFFRPDRMHEQLQAADGAEADGSTLPVHLTAEVRDRLAKVADQLGLNPAVFAARAIEMVCNEIELIEKDELPIETLITRYQARLDLLHAVGETDGRPEGQKGEEGEREESEKG